MYRTRIGHAHLKVRDLDRAVAFYQRFLNLTVTEHVASRYAFLTGGEAHHEIALQEIGPDAEPPPPTSVGLYHVAFEVPDRASLARAYRALMRAGVVASPVDHRIAWALYFRDPDGNGLELYCDTRADPDGTDLWHGRSRPLSEEKLLSVLEETAA